MAKTRLLTWKQRARKAKQAAQRSSAQKKSWIEKLGPETREQISIIEELLLQPWFKGIDWEHYPAEGKRDEFNSWLFKKMGGQKDRPDFRIFEARGGFNGFWFEYKQTGTKLFKPDGTPYAAVKPQWEFLLRMQAKLNVKIALIEGPENAINAIKNYLSL